MCSAERVGGEAAVFRDLTAHDPVTITSDLPIQSPQKLSEHAQNRPTPTALSRVGKDSYRERIRYSFLGLLGHPTPHPNAARTIVRWTANRRG